MSLYTEKEQLASVYHIDDSDSTKTNSYPSVADFSILMFIIRRNEDTIALMGQEVGDYIANVNGSYTYAGSFHKTDKIVWDGGTYIVVNEPRYNESFDAYKLLLRRQI
jgi:hypothetical protein